MARITKDPEERKNEILETAQKLFVEKGYEATSINEIVEKIGVAKGTVYYYFKSKDDILNALLDRMCSEMINNIENVVSLENIKADQKLKMIINTAIDIQDDKGNLLNYVHDPKNAALHQRYEGMVMNVVYKYVSKIVQQGIEQGIFNCEYPEQMIQILFAGASHCLHVDILNVSHDIFIRNMNAFEYAVEKLLGMKEGSFKINTDNILK